MRYFVFIISTSESGENRESFGFDDRFSALQKYHSQMSSAMSGNAINSIQIIIVNSANGIEVADRWVRSVSE